MALIKYNTITPSLRHLCLINKIHLWKGKPVKSLVTGLTKSSGRNNTGRITVRHQGGGHKKLYRTIDFYRNSSVPSIVSRIEHDPNRSSFIALLHSENGQLSYILAPRGLKVGDFIFPGNIYDIKVGNVLSIKETPIGSLIHNIELVPGNGGKLVRSAGCFAQLVNKIDEHYSLIKLPSGERRLLLNTCKVSLGSLSKSDWSETNIGKAGRNRWLGIRPTVRGVAMNPIDHPHGGGEGKTAAGRHPVTPWGKLTKGKRTRSIKKKNPLILKRRFEK